MHARTWLVLLSLPWVAAFTAPLVQRTDALPPKEERTVSQDPLAGLTDLQDVLSLIRDHYVDPPDLENVLAGGIQGALERVHPMNAYLSPEEERLPNPGPAEVGLRLVKRGIYAVVVGVIPGSPAHKAGFQIGDGVRKLDEASIGAMSAWTLERRLRGAEGHAVTLHRYVAGNAQMTRVVLKCARLARPSLDVRVDGSDVLVKVPSLEAGRSSEVASALATHGEGRRLILDLRACFGGTPQEAAKLAGLLAGPGPLGTLQRAGQPEQAWQREGTRHPRLGDVVVLVAPGTVGPAELLASALRQAGILTVGERTAGLAVERTRLALRQGGAVELVTGRWMGAGGEKLDRQGVVPELVIRGLQQEVDPLPKLREALEKRRDEPAKVASLSSRIHRMFSSEAA